MAAASPSHMGQALRRFLLNSPPRIASWWLAFLGVKAAEEGRGERAATRQRGGTLRDARCRWPFVGGGERRRIDSFISRLTSFKIRFDFKKPKKRLERNWSFAHSGSRMQNDKKPDKPIDWPTNALSLDPSFALGPFCCALLPFDSCECFVAGPCCCSLLLLPADVTYGPHVYVYVYVLRLALARWGRSGQSNHSVN